MLNTFICHQNILLTMPHMLIQKDDFKKNPTIRWKELNTAIFPEVSKQNSFNKVCSAVSMAIALLLSDEYCLSVCLMPLTAFIILNALMIYFS